MYVSALAVDLRKKNLTNGIEREEAGLMVSLALKAGGAVSAVHLKFECRVLEYTVS